MKIIDASISTYVQSVLNNGKNIELVSQLDSIDMLIDYIELDEPDLVIISKDIDHEPQADNIIKAIRQIRISKPLVRFIVLAPKYESRFFQKLVNLGVFSIILYDDMEEKLLKEITDPSIEFNFELYEQKHEKREYINKITKGFKRVIAIYSAAPTGKSCIASNLAYILAVQGIKTALFDADVDNRALSYYYYTGKDGKVNLKELVESNILDETENYAHKLLDSKLSIFTANKYDEDLEEIKFKLNTEKIVSIIDVLRIDNEVLLIDTNRNIDNEITQKILTLADTILLVQNLDFRMMEKNKSILKEFEKLNISLRKIVLVVNRYIENKDLTEKTIEKYFEYKFAGRSMIPEDTLGVLKSIRYGKPLVSSKDCSELTLEAYMNLAQFCYGIEKTEKRRGGILSRFLT